MSDDPARLRLIILKLVAQDCQSIGGILDSWAISAYEAALEELDAAGLVRIERGAGRITARFTDMGTELLKAAA